MIENVNNFGIPTSDEEKQERITLCSSCEKKEIIDDIEICGACVCPINDYIIKYKFKNCPLNKWNNI